MGRNRLIPCVFLITLVVLGCSYKLTIKIIDGNPTRPVFSIKKGDSFLTEDSFKVSSLAVCIEENDSFDYKNPIWAFDSTPGSGMKLDTVTYGVVPEGFVERTKAQPLLPNKVYFLYVNASGGVGGIKFDIVEEANGRKAIPVKSN